jgi:hypothetical protein
LKTDRDDEDPHGCDTRAHGRRRTHRADRHINIHFSPEMAGVYANFANVSHPTSATITFARADHEVEDDEIPACGQPEHLRHVQGELIDAMEDNYSKWRTREGIKNLPEFGGQGQARKSRSRSSARRPRRRRSARPAVGGHEEGQPGSRGRRCFDGDARSKPMNGSLAVSVSVAIRAASIARDSWLATVPTAADHASGQARPAPSRRCAGSVGTHPR